VTRTDSVRADGRGWFGKTYGCAFRETKGTFLAKA
jgi:hypothetical protein